MKPKPFKNYGSIGHLPGSRLGPGDHKICDGQARILLEEERDYKDLVIVQEKLDGANVGIRREAGELVALTRKGHRAADSPLDQFKLFTTWVADSEHRFEFLQEGQRICGEWLAMAHGTRYQLTHDPFVVFDLFDSENRRFTYVEMIRRIGDLQEAKLLHLGHPISIKKADKLLGELGHHGALERAEGVVYRVEREGCVDFLGKYVRPGKEDGKYFSEDHSKLIWNWRPDGL